VGQIKTGFELTADKVYLHPTKKLLDDAAWRIRDREMRKKRSKYFRFGFSIASGICSSLRACTARRGNQRQSRSRGRACCACSASCGRRRKSPRPSWL